jgi:hypothetical protein
MRASLLMRTAPIGVLALATVMGADAATAQSTVPENTSRVLSEVTVIAQRIKLESKVASFVYGVAALENDEGLARWHAPVCPLVVGLTRQDGEFVLGRISDIARAAGVPLAGEKCRANLYIFVTSQPTELLRAMAKRDYSVTFGDAAPLSVDEFIDTPRPVRVWFNSYETAAGWDAPLHQGPPPSAQVLGGSMVSALSAPTYSGPGLLGASRLVSNVIFSVAYVYVVVDRARLQGVSRGQFADYVGMVSLAEIKTTAHVGDAQSILTLFDGPPQAALPGMSDWDRAFLKSLYGTFQASTLQRSLITRAMMREIAP